LDFGVLVVTFLVTLYSVFAAIYGEHKKSGALIESARRAMLLTWPLLTLAAGILIYLLITNHFEVKFVYEVTSKSMPTYLKSDCMVGRASRLAALLVLANVCLCIAGHLAEEERNVIPCPRSPTVKIRGRGPTCEG